MNQLKVIDDIDQNMLIGADNDIIYIDIRNCQNPTIRFIVLLNIIRLQATNKRGGNTQSVEVMINNNDTRRFRVSNQVDMASVKQKIFSDKMLQNFKQ